MISGAADSMTSVSGEWTVPEVQPSPSIAASACWVGIGGNGNRKLIQIGTDSVAGPHDGTSSTLYDAFWEVLPDPGVHIATVQVNAGDTIQASIRMIAKGSWSMTLKNVTNRQEFSQMVAYDPDQTTAEWIFEDVAKAGEQGTQGTLPKLTKPFTFKNLSANGIAPGKAPSPFQLYQLVMTNGATTLASPSYLAKNGQEFTIQE